MTQEHNDYTIITNPKRDSDLNRYDVICFHEDHPAGQLHVTSTITKAGARFAARKHLSEQRVLASSEKYRVE